MNSTEFWDAIFSKGKENKYSRVEMPDLQDPVLLRALAHFGDVKGKRIVDIGCGRGAASVFFAHHGMEVVGMDLSRVATENLAQFCSENGIANVATSNKNALELPELGEADFVFGSMILHHIEPFDAFARSLRSVVRPGGKCFFYENNASSKVMIWFRRNIVGKLWVPKYGDPDEFPLMPSEIDHLRRLFDVEVEYPELLYFRMISYYLLRHRCRKPFLFLDKHLYKVPFFRRKSYRQYVCLS